MCEGVLFVAFLGGLFLLAVRQARLEGELRRLKARLDALHVPSAPGAKPPGPAPEARPAAPPLEPAPQAAEPPKPAPPPPAPARPAAAPRKPDFGALERLVGGQAWVWLGAAALALGGAFLVKLSIERGWMGPKARVALALILGGALVAASQLFRERLGRITGALAAAGVACLFAGFLAGTSLYGLFPPALGFSMTALVTALGLLLSLRAGTIVAVVGLVGGFLSPALIGAQEPNPGLLFGYLFLLQAGIAGVARGLGRSFVALLGIAGAVLWVAGWLAGYWHGEEVRLWVGLFVLASTGLYAAFAALETRAGKTRGPSAWALRGGLSVLAALMFFDVAAAGFRTAEWFCLGMLGAGLMALGHLAPPLRHLAWTGLLTTVAALAAWGPHEQDVARYGLTAASLGLLYAAGGLWNAWRTRHPGTWSAVSVCGAALVFLVCWWRLPEPLAGIPWSAQSAALCAAYACIAALWRAGKREPQGLAALALGAAWFASLAVPLALERAWISVAWALEAAAVVWIRRRTGVRALDAVAGALAAAVTVRLAANPWVFAYPTGSGLFLNWLLYGYGVPLAAFALALYVTRDEAASLVREWLAGCAVAIGAVYGVLEVHQAYHPGSLAERSLAVGEVGWIAALWLLAALGLRGLAERDPLRVVRLGAAALEGLAGAALIVPLLLRNPLWSPATLSPRIALNDLAPGYLFPALALGLRARTDRKRPRAAGAFGAASVVMLFAWVTLEVRHAFHPDAMHRGAVSDPESYAYSTAWALYGGALLVAGIATSSALLRIASLPVVLLATFKVFLLDTAGLSDLWRVLSLFGLGFTLLALAWLYQRYVFGRRGRT